MKNWVRTDKEWVDVEEVTFLDVYETPYGDAMEFEYEGKVYDSTIVVGSKPG